MTIIASPTNFMMSPPYFAKFLAMPSMYLLMQNASSSFPRIPRFAQASEMLVNPDISAKRHTVSISWMYGNVSFSTYGADDIPLGTFSFSSLFSLTYFSIHCCSTKAGMYLFKALKNYTDDKVPPLFSLPHPLFDFIFICLLILIILNILAKNNWINSTWTIRFKIND